MRDEHSGEELLFHCQRWLSRDEDDGEICRELSAVRNDVAVLPSEIRFIHSYRHSSQLLHLPEAIAIRRVCLLACSFVC